MTRAVVKNHCRECPFRRASAPGWLGAASGPMDFVDPHWNAEVPLPCHLQVDWEREDCQDVAAKAPLCRGLLTMMKNSCKLPRDPELAAACGELERGTGEIFANLVEFVRHHS